MSVSALTFRPLCVDIGFKDITHSVVVNKSSKLILNNVQGQFNHGNFNAIMGPSGSGKSSLLNVLAGFNPVATGTVSFNGINYPIAKWGKLITSIRSYILQDDFLVPELTVREQLVYSVELKVPNDTTKEAKNEIIETLLERTGLKECEDSTIGVLSGGQRKRVCVASELVNYPPVLFLDEPTTGLDSTSCYRLVELLKSLAQSGCNVITTIHQPNSRVFAMFDSLTVIANGGVIAYSGPAIALAESVNRLLTVKVPQLENPAEFVFEGNNIDKLASISPEERQKVVAEVAVMVEKRGDLNEIKKSWARMEGDDSYLREENLSLSRRKVSDYIGTASLTVNHKTPNNAAEVKYLCEEQVPTSMQRFVVLFRRTLIQSRRDKIFLIGRIIAYILTSTLTGMTFQFIGRDRSLTMSNVAFLYMMSFIFTAGTSIVTMLNSHCYLNVLIRENINSWYDVSSFYIARTVIEAFVNIVIGCVFSIGMWVMTAQQQDVIPALIGIASLSCLHCITMHHFAFIIAMFADPGSLTQLPFAVMMLHVVFGGYFVPLQNLPLWIFWMRYVNFGSYTFTATMKIAYATLKPRHPVEIPCKAFNHPICERFKTGIDILDRWAIDEKLSHWYELMALATYAIVFAMLGWLLLFVFVNRAKRAIARL